MKRVVLPSVLLLALGLVAGCSSYDVARNRSLDGMRHFFVLSNANDNRALDHHIVSALRARGLEAEAGPLTMMSNDAQVVIAYRDNWAWDFGDHLVYLQISARDRRTNQPFANVQFNAKLPTRTPVSGIVDGLVGRLLGAGKR